MIGLVASAAQPALIAHFGREPGIGVLTTSKDDTIASLECKYLKLQYLLLDRAGKGHRQLDEHACTVALGLERGKHRVGLQIQGAPFAV